MTAILTIMKGRLGNDVELKRIPTSNTAVASFSVASTSGFGDKEITTWYRCTIFGKRAESGLMQYLKKGQQVSLSGEHCIREYEKDGVKRQSNDVNVTHIYLIGDKQQSQAPQQQQAPQNAAPTGQGAGFDDFDDSIPF